MHGKKSEKSKKTGQSPFHTETAKRFFVYVLSHRDSFNSSRRGSPNVFCYSRCALSILILRELGIFIYLHVKHEQL